MMRLLDTHNFTLKLFSNECPSYAILSHRWTEAESTLQEVKDQRLSNKIYGFAAFVNAQLRLSWTWVDSCCIDQGSSAELSEGVNSMFEWYRSANVCVAYLADVKHASDQGAFRKSVWFSRGWTLQELLASTVVLFVTEEWEIIGHKGKIGHLNLEAGPNLETLISEVTGVPLAVLDDFSNSYKLSVEQKMRWMDGRETSREEDMSYALFGIFGVTPGANYGEKTSGAAQRLKDAIAKRERDNTGTSLRESMLPLTNPQHVIPFLRDPDFVERIAMTIVGEKFRQPGARVAIVGLGGVGKSQLAIEHCYRTIDGSTTTWVLWLHASSATRFDQEVYSLIQDLEVPGWQDKNADVLQLFRGWLNDNTRHWLIVLDNADDADFLFESLEAGRSGKARIEYIPTCQHGSLLTTTRRLAVAQRLTSDRHIIHLHPEQELAVKLLITKLDMSVATIELIELATFLDYIPLAIAQAAAYIKQKLPRCTIGDYLGKLKKSEQSRSSLLKVQSNELRRDRQEAQNSVLLTWQISFEHVRIVRQSAADLLSIMSFYDNQGIPDFLLRGNIDDDHENDDEHDDEDHGEDDEEAGNPFEEAGEAFEEDIAMLRDYSFVSITTEKYIFQMHRLVQLAAQVWLREHTTQYAHHQAQSLRKLDNHYPVAHFEQWKRCQTLQAHAKHICMAKVNEDAAAVALASVMCKAAWFADSQGLYREAEIMAERSLRDRKRILGMNHPDTLTSMDNVAVIHQRQGRYKAAAELEVKVLEIRRRVLGEEHPDTLGSMGNLAMTYRHQGQYEDAAELGEKVLEIRQRVLRVEHPDTLMSMNNLALTYSYQGRYGDAAELGEKVLEIRQKVLRAEHPDTLMSMNNLAVTFFYQDRLQKAYELTKQCLALRSHILGATHPHTLSSARWFQTMEEKRRAVGRQEMEASVAELAIDEAAD